MGDKSIINKSASKSRFDSKLFSYLIEIATVEGSPEISKRELEAANLTRSRTVAWRRRSHHLRRSERFRSGGVDRSNGGRAWSNHRSVCVAKRDLTTTSTRWGRSRRREIGRDSPSHLPSLARRNKESETRWGKKVSREITQKGKEERVYKLRIKGGVRGLCREDDAPSS